jgi:hypothetical protein
VEVLSSNPKSTQKKKFAKCWWLRPVILATQEAAIRRIKVQSHPGQIVLKTLSRKTLHKNRAGGVAEGVGPELKLQYPTKKASILEAGHDYLPETNYFFSSLFPVIRIQSLNIVQS